jgi:peptidoglycan hydrolase CwlO-like protein
MRKLRCHLGGWAMVPASEDNVLRLNVEDRNRAHAVDGWERDRAEGEEAAPYYKRRAAGVWICLATLAVVVIAAMVYGYAVLEQEGLSVEQVPGMTKSLSAIGHHVANVENRLAASGVEQQKLAAELHSIDAGSKAAFGETQEQTSRIARQTEVLLKNLNQQNSTFHSQVSQLVSQRNADLARLSQVEQQLTDARTELATAREDYARQLADLREQQGEQHRELASLGESLPTQQSSIQVSKNQAVDLTSGVSFQLTKIDLRRQRYDGWIKWSGSNQKLWVQNQAIRRPVVFYPSEHAQPLLMVLMSLSQKGAAGYVLKPASNGSAGQGDEVSAIGTQAPPKELSSGAAAGRVAAP